MLWLSLYFASLPLDIACRGVPGQGCAHTGAVAVIDGAGTRMRVLQCDAAARARGLHPGMSLNAALVLEPRLTCRRHDPEAERAALERLAGWAGRFTSMVSLAPPRELVLEVQGSLRLFGGLEALCAALREGLAVLGYEAAMGVAPSPLAAGLLARGGAQAPVTEPEALPAALGRLPVSVLEPEPRLAAGFERLGVTRLAGLLRLPRDGLARRFGRELPERLERMLGERPDPRQAYRPPARFSARLELPVLAQETEMLLFAANRLLQELAGTLVAQVRAVERFQLRLHHEQGEPTRVTAGLLRPSRDPRHWMGLLRERLGRLELERPVRAVEVRARRLVAYQGESGELFGKARAGQDWPELLERLQARLGAGAVQGLAGAADHRPEHAWRSVPPGAPAAGDPVPERAFAARPLWLLPEPVPVQPAEHWRLCGPERIESGWWDGDGAARDYFLAQTPEGERLWVYRDRRGARGWFLHGVFA